MVSSTALKCSTILARIRVVFVTRGALLVAEDGGSICFNIVNDEIGNIVSVKGKFLCHWSDH